jgi:hypothetical protein
MKPQPAPRAHSENEVVRLVWIAVFISVFSFLFYQRREEILLYGDAVAHINIARRVFDSKTPGPLQLGTVWLPLPHLLIMPFIVSNKLWQSGAGGSFPSMAAFVLATLGIFRLMRANSQTPEASGTASPPAAQTGPPKSRGSARLPAAPTKPPEASGFQQLSSALNEEIKVWSWLSALAFAANPNLIYLQSTAMGESLYLAFFIWTIVFFAEFVRKSKNRDAQAGRTLTKSAMCLAAACLTRYDGWFLAAVLIVAVLFFYFRQVWANTAAQTPVFSRALLARFILIAAAGPALWFAYNAAVYRNPFEFANGPYSAKAIELKTHTVNPANRNVIAGGFYFLKSAELNIAAPPWLGRLWLLLALIGAAFAAITGRARAALFLWLPLPFYALSLAYGKVPIFVPSWWPFSLYNVRYGLELLPALAVFGPLGLAFLFQSAVRLAHPKPSVAGWSPIAAIAVFLILLIASDATIWRADPICYQEASVNNRGRVTLDRELATWFRSFPPSATLLMYLGEHSGALEQAGIPFNRVINEGNHRVWKQPSDPNGLWERALADPAAYADYVIGFEGDPVWKSAEEHHLTGLLQIHTTGQPPAAIFRGRMPDPSPNPNQGK